MSAKPFQGRRVSRLMMVLCEVLVLSVFLICRLRADGIAGSPVNLRTATELFLLGEESSLPASQFVRFGLYLGSLTSIHPTSRTNPKPACPLAMENVVGHCIAVIAARTASLVVVD